MSSPTPTAAAPRDLIDTIAAFARAIRTGDPIAVDDLTFVPLFGPTASRSFLPLAAALDRGHVTIREIGAAGDVNCLHVDNAGDEPVLLFDGEQLVGAKQDRVVNTSILVPPRARIRIPVSCVEQGRWNYRTRTFAAGAILSTDMRRSKMARVTTQLRWCGRFDADQRAVWREVAGRARRRGVHAPTMALSDVLAADAGHVDAVRAAAPVQPGQTGLAAFLAGHLLAADAVGSAEAYAHLHDRLVAAAAAEAVDRPRSSGRQPPSLHAAVHDALSGATTVATPPGSGTDVRAIGKAFRLAALVADGDVVHLAVFSTA